MHCKAPKMLSRFIKVDCTGSASLAPTTSITWDVAVVWFFLVHENTAESELFDPSEDYILTLSHYSVVSLVQCETAAVHTADSGSYGP